MKNENDVIFWRDVPVLIRDKIWHIHKIGGKHHRDFTVTYGEIPGVRFNPVTRIFEAVINYRGNAYAARRRQMYRKGYKRVKSV
ncbi:MAG: hypothetical protein WC783_03030 [Candidatus Paceibacterota bacterium]